MEITTLNPPQTKQCPFCAETIQAAAIKCRFCNEFLNTSKAKALQAGAASDSQPQEDKDKAESVLFEGKPSLWALTGSVTRGLFFFVIAAFLIYYPLESLSIFYSWFHRQPEPVASSAVTSSPADTAADSEITEEAVEVPAEPLFKEELFLQFRRYRILSGIGLAALVVLILLFKTAQLKMTRYEVSTDRIEWSRGLLDRKVDNLDMFRVVDLKLRRSLFDCIIGIGTVTVITTDKSDPEFTFAKIRNPRKLYDVIKKASLEADRRNNTVHIE